MVAYFVIIVCSLTLTENDTSITQPAGVIQQAVQITGRLVGVGNISYKEKLVLEG